MMGRGISILMLVLFCMLAAGEALPEVVLFTGKVELRGAKNVSGEAIVRMARIVRSGKGISVDMDLLKNVLGNDPRISSYSIEKSSGNLVINIQEKYPLYLFLVVDKELSVPVLVDDNMKVVFSGAFFGTDMPIVIVKRNVFDLGRESSELENLMGNIRRIRSAATGFCQEIREIELTGDGSLKVFLKSRKTMFIISNDRAGFLRLEKTAGYLDAVRRYPDSMDLRTDRVLVK